MFLPPMTECAGAWLPDRFDAVHGEPADIEGMSLAVPPVAEGPVAQKLVPPFGRAIGTIRAMLVKCIYA
jgi:hypothetical protein